MDWKGIIRFLIHKAAGKSHKRISFAVGFYVKPEIWMDCPHVDTYREAMSEACREDELEKRVKR